MHYKTTAAAVAEKPPSTINKLINNAGLLPSTNSVAYQRLVLQTCHGPSQLSVLHLPLERFTARSEARYWLRIAISAYPTCTRRRH